MFSWTSSDLQTPDDPQTPNRNDIGISAPRQPPLLQNSAYAPGDSDTAVASKLMVDKCPGQAVL